MATRCPKCKKGWMRQQVSVFVETDADARSLNKKAIRKKNVEILGVGWGQGSIFCSAGCGNFTRLGARDCEDSPTGLHNFTVDLEYDQTGQTINCEHCGRLPPDPTPTK